MKLERLHEYVLPVIATLGGMGLAVYCGKLTGTGQMGTLATIIGLSVATALVLGLRQNIWLLIPTGWVLYGQIPVLPLPFAVRDVVVMTVFVAFLALRALKIVRIRPKVEFLDLMVLVLIVYMVTVFVRNPVGANALGSERVGGRPYFDMLISVVAYWVLSQAQADRLLTPFLPLFVLASQGFEMVLNMIAFHVPRAAPLLASIYTGVDPSNYEAASVWRQNPDQTTGRQMYLAGFGNTLAITCFSFWRPITVISPIYWWRFFVFTVTCAIVALSGFRSGLIAIVAYMIISSLIRRRIRDLLLMGVIAVPTLAILLALQGRVIDLPKSVQRSLSFLPAAWDEYAVHEAQSSTQWRLELWKIYLTEDKYIDSKWLGDGFGFSQRQLAVMNARRMYMTSDMEEFLIVGNVHSGPLSTIRYAGYCGLAIFVVVLILTARTAWKLARRAEGTPYYHLALFICIPLIFAPPAFIFIFGSFDGNLPGAIYAVGMLKMLGNTLDVWEAGSRSTVEPGERTRSKRRTPAGRGELQPA